MLVYDTNKNTMEKQHQSVSAVCESVRESENNTSVCCYYGNLHWYVQV